MSCNGDAEGVVVVSCLEPCSSGAGHNCNLIWVAIEQLGQCSVWLLHSFSLLGKSFIPAFQRGLVAYSSTMLREVMMTNVMTRGVHAAQ